MLNKVVQKWGRSQLRLDHPFDRDRPICHQLRHSACYDTAPFTPSHIWDLIRRLIWPWLPVHELYAWVEIWAVSQSEAKFLSSDFRNFWTLLCKQNHTRIQTEEKVQFPKANVSDADQSVNPIDTLHKTSSDSSFDRAVPWHSQHLQYTPRIVLRIRITYFVLRLEVVQKGTKWAPKNKAPYIDFVWDSVLYLPMSDCLSNSKNKNYGLNIHRLISIQYRHSSSVLKWENY